jgi:(E)-4-hydroxy-3-methylbut-2-enyl-diphosphate synthase
MESIIKELTEYTKGVKKKIKIAGMGCVVNGPGEARDADFGFAGGGNGQAIIFEKGKVVKKITTDEIIGEIKRRIDNF